MRSFFTSGSFSISSSISNFNCTIFQEVQLSNNAKRCLKFKEAAKLQEEYKELLFIALKLTKEQ